MSEHDISLVTAKAGSVIAEGMKVSLATAAGALTPSTITAMVGIAEGTALQLAPVVTDAMTILQTHAGYDANSAGYIPGISGVGGSASATLTNLTTLQGQLMPPGNHAAFGSYLTQAQGHIADSQELKKATDFISNTTFSDYGSGITNMSSMATQGLDGALGNLSHASKALEAAGPAFDLKDMSKFGTSAGLVDKLNSVKLGNASGVNAAIADAGLDLNMPEHRAQVDKVMASINDPKVISSVTAQLGMASNSAITNLKDFTDLNKLANPNEVSGLTGGLSGLSDKFGDMGAKFTSPAAASSMLNNIEIPSVPSLNAAAPSLSGLMGGMSSSISGMTGQASGVSALNGANGLPNITDFTHAVSGGPEISALAGVGTTGITAEHITALNDSITKSQGLMSSAGIDLTSPPMPSLGSAMNFATGLHKFGADTSGSGITDVLSGMATPDSASGDAIKASLAEGKNKALMMAQGIAPLKFGN